MYGHCLLCINFLEVSQTNLLNSRYIFLSWIFISKWCEHKVNKTVLFKPWKTLFFLDFGDTTRHKVFSFFSNGTEFSISNKYGQSCCKTALSANTGVHIQKQRKQNLSVPQTCPHLLTETHPPKDRAGTEGSMLQINWRWNLGFELTCYMLQRCSYCCGKIQYHNLSVCFPWKCPFFNRTVFLSH